VCLREIKFARTPLLKRKKTENNGATVSKRRVTDKWSLREFHRRMAYAGKTVKGYKSRKYNEIKITSPRSILPLGPLIIY
jgi:hypothetical protein